MKREKKNRSGSNLVVKVPVIMQMEAVECGAACLCMILSYYGKHVSLERMRFECGVSKHGTSARNLLRTARAYHLKAHGYKYEPEDLKKEGIFPCIIHWNFAHFVVLKGFKNGKAYINDPELGSIEVPMDRFDRSFTGIVLFMSPEEDFAGDGRGRERFYVEDKDKKEFYFASCLLLVVMLVLAITSIIIAGLSRYYVDRMLNGLDQAFLGFFVLIFAIIAGINICALWIGSCEIFRYKERMGVQAGLTFMEKALRLPMRFFVQRRPADLLEREASCLTMTELAMDRIVPAFGGSILMFLYLTIMCRYSFLLTAIGLLSLLINLWISSRAMHRRENAVRMLRQDESQISNTIIQGMKNIETIKANGSEGGLFSRWSGYQANMNRQKQQIEDSESRLGGLADALKQITFLGISFLGVYMLLQGKFTLGMIFAFQILFMRIAVPEGRLIKTQTAWMNLTMDYIRYRDLLEYEDEDIFAKEEKESLDGRMAKLNGSISMRGVGYGYVKLKDPVVEDISIDIAQGERIAIVGSVGAGKSTIVHLLSGLVKPWDGEILYDGKRMSEISKKQFRASVAVVSQESIIFEGTVQENICGWDEDIDPRKMFRAAKDAYLHEEILRWTDGYQHEISGGGDNLSGGQRQKLEIARALLQEPSVLILDEATASLDANEEQEIMKNIRERNITCVIISHRLASIHDCDCIYVMDEGRIVESGTHDELMGLDGVYAELIRSN